MSFSTLPAGHFHGGAHISAEGGDGKDLVTLLNLLNTDMLAAARAMDQKDSVVAATTANITLSGAQTIDSVAVVAGNRVLVKNQGTGSQNGIYVAAAAAWARATDMAAGADAAGALTHVEQGTASANKWFACTDNKGSAVVGTDALTFADVSYAMSHEFLVGLLGGGASEHYHVGPAQRGSFVVKAASVGNLALTGAQTIDDIACAAGVYVFAKNQTAPAENGVYKVAAGAWTRASGLAAGASASGCVVHVDQGTVNANTNWQCTDAIAADIVGTNDLTFVDASTLGAHAAATAKAGHAGGAGTHTHATAGAEGGKIDHGTAIDGLTDDDHTQYETKAALYSATDGMRAVHVVRAASTGNLALTGAQTIDAVACIAGERVLCKDQTAPAENGIWVVAAGAWARAADMPAAATVHGALVYVCEGTANIDQVFKCTTNAGADVVGTNSLTFTQCPITNAITGVAPGMKVVGGIATTGSASDTIVTGLTTCVAVVASLNDDPVDGCMHASANIGDQAGAPAAGSFYLKTWKSTDGDATLIAASTFSIKCGWIAYGT